MFVSFRVLHIDFGPSLLSNSPSRALGVKEAGKGFEELLLDRTSGSVDVSRKEDCPWWHREDKSSSSCFSHQERTGGCPEDPAELRSGPANTVHAETHIPQAMRLLT